jgi:hypothetical protein
MKGASPGFHVPHPTYAPQDPHHLCLHHEWAALSHLLHKAEGPHETLALQLPEQDIQGD